MEHAEKTTLAKVDSLLSSLVADDSDFESHRERHENIEVLQPPDYEADTAAIHECPPSPIEPLRSLA